MLSDMIRNNSTRTIPLFIFWQEQNNERELYKVKWLCCYNPTPSYPQPPLNSRLRVIAANLAQLSYKMWVFRNELSNNAELFYSYN